MLSPETIDALEKALDAVIQECGDDPKMAHLADALSQAQTVLDSLESPEHEGQEKAEGEVDHDADDAPPPEPVHGEPTDPHSFADAEKAMTERRGAAKKNPFPPKAKA